jgi:cytidylate kinase
MVITIDGPAASGKSSTARAVAAALAYHHVDSGSLYRALTAARARLGGASDRWTELEVLDAARIVSLEPVPGGFEPRLNGVAADQEMRGSQVTSAVARVAQMPGVREWVNARMRLAADHHDVVVDGRDMGTVVFPAAELKIYLVADPWHRARRRLLERDRREPFEGQIVEEMAIIKTRDVRDAAQSVPATDAVVMDTSDISQDEQVVRILALVEGVRGGGRGTR